MSHLIKLIVYESQIRIESLARVCKEKEAVSSTCGGQAAET